MPDYVYWGLHPQTPVNLRSKSIKKQILSARKSGKALAIIGIYTCNIMELFFAINRRDRNNHRRV